MAVAICIAVVIGFIEYFLILGLFGVPIAALCLFIFILLSVMVWIRDRDEEVV